MACGKTVLFLLATLASLAYVLAEEGFTNVKDNEPPPNENPLKDQSNEDQHERAGIFGSSGGGLFASNASGLPNFFGGSSDSNPFGQFFGNGLDIFSQIVSGFGQLIPGLSNSNSSGLSNLFPSSSFPQLGRSQQLDLPKNLETEAGDTNSASPNDRFFFFHHLSNNNVPIGCNYTIQPGYRCAGCREQLLCNSNNVGRIRVCPFYAPYCYNGVCGTFVNTTCTDSAG